MKIIIGARYQHYKKKTIYVVTGFAHHTEDQEKLVLYRPEIEPVDLATSYPEGVVFARPYSQFIEQVESAEGLVNRFDLVDLYEIQK